MIIRCSPKHIAFIAAISLTFTPASTAKTGDTTHMTRVPASKQAWQYRWQKWLPPHWRRLSQCETHMSWRFNNGIYEGFVAFYYGSWDHFKYAGYPNSANLGTPWQQYRVALRIADKYGLATPWGCWRGRQHAWVRGGVPEYGTYK